METKPQIETFRIILKHLTYFIGSLFIVIHPRLRDLFRFILMEKSHNFVFLPTLFGGVNIE
jgi:hypothetical protein